MRAGACCRDLNVSEVARVRCAHDIRRARIDGRAGNRKGDRCRAFRAMQNSRIDQIVALRGDVPLVDDFAVPSIDLKSGNAIAHHRVLVNAHGGDQFSQRAANDRPVVAVGSLHQGWETGRLVL